MKGTAITSSTAGALNSVPEGLLTATEYVPASLGMTLANVSVAFVAPSISTPFRRH